MDQWILEGRVSIDGARVLSPGVSILPGQSNVAVDGKAVRAPIERKLYFAFNKPKKVLTTMHDPQQRPCIGDYLKKFDVRLFPVGRLDFDAEGLLILTNDGDWAQSLLHPKYEHARIYEVAVQGRPSNAALIKLQKGLQLEDGPAAFSAIRKLREEASLAHYEVTIAIGRKHIVKRLWKGVGHPVVSLKRIQMAGIKLNTLKPGDHRPLKKSEIDSCLS